MTITISANDLGTKPVQEVFVQLEHGMLLYETYSGSVTDAIETYCDALKQLDAMTLSPDDRRTLKLNSRNALRETMHTKDSYEQLQEENGRLRNVNQFLLEELAKRPRPTEHLIT
jgi:hypothetical protein